MLIRRKYGWRDVTCSPGCFWSRYCMNVCLFVFYVCVSCFGLMSHQCFCLCANLHWELLSITTRLLIHSSVSPTHLQIIFFLKPTEGKARLHIHRQNIGSFTVYLILWCCFFPVRGQLLRSLQLKPWRMMKISLDQSSYSSPMPRSRG